MLREETGPAPLRKFVIGSLPMVGGGGAGSYDDHIFNNGAVKMTDYLMSRKRMDDETREALEFALVGAVFLGLFALSCWAFVTLVF